MIRVITMTEHVTPPLLCAYVCKRTTTIWTLLLMRHMLQPSSKCLFINHAVFTRLKS